MSRDERELMGPHLREALAEQRPVTDIEPPITRENIFSRRYTEADIAALEAADVSSLEVQSALSEAYRQNDPEEPFAGLRRDPDEGVGSGGRTLDEEMERANAHLQERPKDYWWRARRLAILRRKAEQTLAFELEIGPPGPPGRKPWWTVTIGETGSTRRHWPGVEDEHPADWGLECVEPEAIARSRGEGRTRGEALEKILNEVQSAGAKIRIATMRGPEALCRMAQAALRDHADARPASNAELRRFAFEERP